MGVLTGKRNMRQANEDQIALTVIPQGPGSQDIHVEIKRELTAKKRKGQRRFAIFLLVAACLMLFPMARNLIMYFKMHEEYAQLREQNQMLVDIKTQLEDEKEALHTPEIIERMAREELDMVMPGESKVYQAIPTDDMPIRENLRSGEAMH